jgi:hypothetical protein
MGVRFIAIHDNYDGLDEINQSNYDIATPIKELVNEMYAADVSRKVRNTKRLLGEQGKFANSRAPYGYLKSPEDKHVLIVDDNVSHIVIRIYEQHLSGMTARAIAELFNHEGIPTPNEYYYTSAGKPNPYKRNKNAWCSGTVMNILKNPAYYGAMVNGKRAVTSFKNKRVIVKAADDWIIVEGTHEPIITKDQWSEAQLIRKKNKLETVRRSANGEVSLFAGIVKCADCDGNLIFTRRVMKDHVNEFYRCTTYNQKGKDVCPPHRIDHAVLYEAVLADIKEYAVLAVQDENALIDRILKSNDEFKNKNISRYERNIRESKNRIREIDGLIQSLLEEKISGNVSDVIFKRMTAKFETEQTKLITDVEQMEIELAECQRVQSDLTGWISRIRECLTITELTRPIVCELIERIEIHEVYDADGEKNIDMEIFYKFGLTNAGKEKRQDISPPTKDRL